MNTFFTFGQNIFSALKLAKRWFMKNVNIRFFEDEKNTDAISIEMKGDLSIENACIIKNELIKKIKLKKIFNIKIADLTAFDLAFYQLLLSLNLTLKKQNKILNAKMDIDDNQADLFLKSGFDLNFNA